LSTRRIDVDLAMGEAARAAVEALRAMWATPLPLPGRLLLAALDRPATVVPVHWDNFETELTNPPPVTKTDQDRLDKFLTAVRKAAPRTRILLPQYLTPYTIA
jgi:hypothetical protein